MASGKRSSCFAKPDADRLTLAQKQLNDNFKSNQNEQITFNELEVAKISVLEIIGTSS